MNNLQAKALKLLNSKIHSSPKFNLLIEDEQIKVTCIDIIDGEQIVFSVLNSKTYAEYEILKFSINENVNYIADYLKFKEEENKAFENIFLTWKVC